VKGPSPGKLMGDPDPTDHKGVDSPWGGDQVNPSKRTRWSLLWMVLGPGERTRGVALFLNGKIVEKKCGGGGGWGGGVVWGRGGKIDQFNLLKGGKKEENVGKENPVVFFWGGKN